MKKSKIINNLLLFIGLVIFAVAAFQLFLIFGEYKQGTDTYQQIAEKAEKTEKQKDSQKMESDTFWYQDANIDFDYLKTVNEDINGWIRFDSNGIDYPVVKGTDNEEYLYTMADKTKNKSGSVFMETLCEPDFEDVHTILYGHNMKNSSMFGLLKKYKTDEDYYGENAYFTVYTKDMTFRYQIFAYYDVEETDSIYQVGFAADDVFSQFIKRMQERSYRDTGIMVEKKDKIVTLSTCSAVGKRLVVNAKRIDSKSR